MRVRARRRGLLAALVVGLVPLLVALPATPQAANDPDPRNNARGETGNNPDCIGCHRSWGMRDSHLVQALFPQSLKRGEPATFEVRVDNPWLMEVRGLRVTVRQPPDAPRLLAPLDAGGDEGPSQASLPVAAGNLSNPGMANTFKEKVPPRGAEHRFDVGPRARQLRAHLSLYPLDPLEGVAPRDVEVDAKVLQPGRAIVGNWTPDDPGALERDIVVDARDLVEGRWTFRINYTGGDPPRLAYAWTGLIEYGGLGANAFELPVPDVRIAPYESLAVPFRMVGVEDGEYELEVEARATLYFDHTTGGYDWDNYTRYRTVRVSVGDRYVGPLQAATVRPATLGDSRGTAAEVVGLASAALLPPALFLGGTYGRASRRLFNALLGGAKRRVMFHSAISLGLTAAALAHVGLFLLEARYSVLKGMLWGGLGLVALLGLALTGYYQIPLIQRYGHRWWRVAHAALGVLVIVFTAWHALVDGAHFVELRERVPEWLTAWNLTEA